MKPIKKTSPILPLTTAVKVLHIAHDQQKKVHIIYLKEGAVEPVSRLVKVLKLDLVNATAQCYDYTQKGNRTYKFEGILAAKIEI